MRPTDAPSDTSVPDAAQALLKAMAPVGGRLSGAATCPVCLMRGTHTLDCEWEALRAALAAAPPDDEPAKLPEPETLLRVVCECGHTAAEHSRSDGWCYERLDVEVWCPCKRFVSTGALRAAAGSPPPTLRERIGSLALLEEAGAAVSEAREAIGSMLSPPPTPDDPPVGMRAIYGASGRVVGFEWIPDAPAGPPPTNGPTRERLRDALTMVVGDIGPIDHNESQLTAAANLLAYRLRASHRPDNDPEADTSVTERGRADDESVSGGAVSDLERRS